MKTKYDSVLGKLRESDEVDLEGVIRTGFTKLEADGCKSYIYDPYVESDKIITNISEYSITLDNTSDYEVGGSIILDTPIGEKTVFNISDISELVITVQEPFPNYYYGVGAFKLFIENEEPYKYSNKCISFGEDAQVGGDNAVALGKGTKAYKNQSIALGEGSISAGENAIACGSFLPGPDLNCEASGKSSQAFGVGARAKGLASHAIGASTASGDYSHAEGYGSNANGVNSHSQGIGTIAGGDHSHAEGYGSEASADCSHAGGKHSKTIAEFDMVRGNTGLLANTANNIFRVHGDTGNVTCDGAFTGGGADYAETFEWNDGNPNNEDRAGFFVELVNGDKIQKYSQYGEAPLGIVSAMPAVVGDAHFLKWQGIWQLDDFGRKVLETRWKRALKAGQEYYKDDADNIWKYHESPTNKEPIPFDEGTLIPEDLTWEDYSFPKLNTGYVVDREYIPRLERPEWDAIGFIGKLRVFDDGQAVAGNWIKPVAGGTAEKTTASAAIKYRVLKRISDNVIEILFR